MSEGAVGARGRPVPLSAGRLHVVIEGFLNKQATHLPLGLKPWQRRFFVLYGNSMELRYYKTAQQSVFGSVPLDERGSIPLESVTAIVLPQHEVSQGVRFALHTGWGAGHSFPRDAHTHPAAHHAPRVVWLEASSDRDRAAWIQRLSALIGVLPTTEAVSDLLSTRKGRPSSPPRASFMHTCPHGCMQGIGARGALAPPAAPVSGALHIQTQAATSGHVLTPTSPTHGGVIAL